MHEHFALVCPRSVEFDKRLDFLIDLEFRDMAFALEGLALEVVVVEVGLIVVLRASESTV